MTITNSDFVEQIAASGSYIAQTDEGTARWLAHDLVEVTIFTQTFYDLPPHRLAYPIVKNLHIAPDRKSVSFENEAPIQCTAL